MKNKVAYRMMMERLNSPAWESANDQAVKEVQRLARLANGEKLRKYAQIIAVFQDGKMVAKGTSGELSKLMNINSATIRKRAERNFMDARGREFKFVEDGDDNDRLGVI